MPSYQTSEGNMNSELELRGTWSSRKTLHVGILMTGPLKPQAKVRVPRAGVDGRENRPEVSYSS